jgi:HEPN domain-containing protein/predicted nucleotidyltransferase
MKRSLSHLPERKKYEVCKVRETILQCEKKCEMIILFGSHARGDWVEDKYCEDHITYEYQSDFDILILVRSRGKANKGPWMQIERAIRENLNIKTPVSIIVHTVDEFNEKIRRAEYFFNDIKKEGIMLHDSGNFKLDRRRKINLKLRLEKAEEDYDCWFEKAGYFFDDFKHNLELKRYSIAAFYLHQATEHAYTALLLVYTGYKPKVHDLEKLGEQAVQCDPRFLAVFPRQTEEQKKRFKLLKNAYIDARYKKDYKITPEELEYLGERVKALHDLTRKSCTEKIQSLTP